MSGFTFSFYFKSDLAFNKDKLYLSRIRVRFEIEFGTENSYRNVVGFDNKGSGRIAGDFCIYLAVYKDLPLPGSESIGVSNS